ncbi:MAG: CoB--CoM heterodisulfide reductase iron-sulfur subunit A family protein, partial [Ignavibacteriaceae bacterium]|nr:CoB--CoM heterodisulfide reductase iron-sulfur subunit A family protein [Ignavibacteriaceae bacterium]
MAVETKVGVYLCSGCEIGEAVNIDELGKIASEESKVPVCKNNSWLCSEAGVEEIKNDIKNENLNRVVIGACSQRFLADVFNFDSDVLVERVNLRENVVWTHKPNDEDTQMLASDYLRMGIAKARNSETPKPQPIDANETILVVGGGVSGLTSAIAATKAGNSVVLTEKEDKLGGWLNKFHKVNLGNSPFTEIESTGIEELISEVES